MTNRVEEDRSHDVGILGFRIFHKEQDCGWNLEFSGPACVGVGSYLPPSHNAYSAAAVPAEGYFLSLGRQIDCFSTSPLTMKSFGYNPVPMSL